MTPQIMIAVTPFPATQYPATQSPVFWPLQAATTPAADPGGMPLDYPGSMPADYPVSGDDEVLPGLPTDPIPNPEPETPSLPDPDPAIYTPSDMPRGIQ